MNYQKIYLSLIESTKNRERSRGYYETHHILPKCLGGSNDKSNLVCLTIREHFIAHKLLTRIHPNSLPIYRAFHAMGTRCMFNSKLFEYERKRMVELQCGRSLPESTKLKMSITRKGIPKTEETKKRMSKPKSLETRKKMSAAQEQRLLEGRNNKKGYNKGKYFWINNGITAKRIKQNEQIPEGWNRGHKNLHIGGVNK
jgi:hypothetical protein